MSIRAQTALLVSRVAARRNIHRRVCAPGHPMPSEDNPLIWSHVQTFPMGDMMVCAGCGYRVEMPTLPGAGASSASAP